MYGDNVNEQNNRGDTSLHWACSIINDKKYRGDLLLAGADETITNDDGLTPAHVVASANERNGKLLELLDVSNGWKMLVRSRRLRRRTAVQVMMTLVKWKVKHRRSKLKREKLKMHLVKTCAVVLTLHTNRAKHQLLI